MNKTYNDVMHRIGRIYTVIALFILLAIPVLISLIAGVSPNYSHLLKAILALSILYLPGGIVEVSTYSPVLGTSATYLAFVTGNLANLKIPCVLNARTLAKTEIGTEANEVISTLAVAFSSITTIVVMAVGVLLLTPLRPILTLDLLQPAFNWVVPALFGALGYQYFKKNPKIILAPLVFIVILSILLPSFVQGQLPVVIILSAIVAVLWARFLQLKKLI